MDAHYLENQDAVRNAEGTGRGRARRLQLGTDRHIYRALRAEAIRRESTSPDLRCSVSPLIPQLHIEGLERPG